MPSRVADYAIIGDGSFTLNNANNVTHFHDQDIRIPHADIGSSPILVFRVSPTVPVTLHVNLNGTEILGQGGHNFTTDPQRSWHQVIPPNLLKQSNNELTFRITGPGSVAVFSLVLFFQANIPSV